MASKFSYTLMGSYFSPTAPPFCFWNSMYRSVLAKNASADESGVVVSLCISVVINSISPWMVATVICGLPFSKKYKYLQANKTKVIYLPSRRKQYSNVTKLWTISEHKNYLFSISMKRETGPVLPLVAFDICWAAFAILNARFRQSITLVHQEEKSD